MFHLRFTPHDISGSRFKFLENYDRFILAFENKDKYGRPVPDHYHIYIEADYDHQSIRGHAKADLKIPKDGGRGRNNKYYCLDKDWRDPSYICKWDDIRMSRGFSEKQIMDLVIEGKKKYLKNLPTTATETVKQEKKVKISFQQAVIADAAADWYNYKRRCKEEDQLVDESEVLDFVAKAMRVHGRGINEYLVKDIAYGVLYDDLDYRGLILKRLKSRFLA